MKTNIYKKEIIKIFKRNHLLSIADVHKQIPHANYSTIYRNIRQLVKDDKLVKQIFGKHIILYEINDIKKHHGHFLCNICKKIEKLEMPKNEQIAKNGYRVQEYLLTGLCNKCKINN